MVRTRPSGPLLRPLAWAGGWTGRRRGTTIAAPRPPVSVQPPAAERAGLASVRRCTGKPVAKGSEARPRCSRLVKAERPSVPHLTPDARLGHGQELPDVVPVMVDPFAQHLVDAQVA